VKIALVSEHASPLATTGSVDSGGQNIYVANVPLSGIVYCRDRSRTQAYPNVTFTFLGFLFRPQSACPKKVITPTSSPAVQVRLTHAPRMVWPSRRSP
jgi:hypothetical protein